jgi:hypothetical protein
MKIKYFRTRAAQARGEAKVGTLVAGPGETYQGYSGSRTVPAGYVAVRTPRREIIEFPLDMVTPETGSNPQEHSSADTSRPQVPSLFKAWHRMQGWDQKTINLDWGGGKYDLVQEWFDENGLVVVNLVVDPYNRTEHHNTTQLRIVAKSGGTDTATLANVLNVIKEPEERLGTLAEIGPYVIRGGVLLISVYAGDSSGVGRKTRDGWQENRPLKTYLPEVQQVYPQAELVGKAGLIVVQF